MNEGLQRNAGKAHLRASAPSLLCLSALLLSVLAVYASSLFFGFIWDDPIFYGHVAEMWWQTLFPTADYQFYRPLTLLYFWLFRRPDGTFAVVGMHGFQISFHLLNVVLAFAISRRLGLGRGVAVTVATLFAFYPFSQQAIAWAVPHHPLTAVLLQSAWLAYMIARPVAASGTPLSPRPVNNERLWLIASLILFLLALAVQENSVTLAVIPLLYELLVRQPVTDRHTFMQFLRSPRRVGWAWLYPLISAIYVFIWLFLPRQAELTGTFLDGRNLPYFLQAVAYPLFGRPQGYEPGQEWTASVVVLLALAVTAVLLAVAAWRRRGRVALFGLAWAVAGFLPMLVGLDYDYVSLGPRLLYTSALGVALLWGCALWPEQGERLIIRAASIGVIALIIIQSIWLVCQFQRFWQVGTAHLAEAVAVMDEHENGEPEAASGRLLFLNFPDRYAPQRPPYPLGYWGLTLAPVAVDLEDFQVIWTGNETETLSRAMPWLDQATREGGPYEVDMRGVIVQPEELAALAAEVDAVYLTRYLPDGRFQLQVVGSLQLGATTDCPLARFGEAICLHEVQVEETADTYEVTLLWSTTEPVPPHLTIFTHLGQTGQPPIAQADGDTWLGALPLANWHPGDLIVEQRTLPKPPLEAELVLQVGVYNWVDGQRLPGLLVVDGARPEASLPLPENAWGMEIERLRD